MRPLLLAVLSMTAACATVEPGYHHYDEVDYGFATKVIRGKRAKVGVAMAELGAGRKEPIVLIHPWGLSMKVWADVAPTLAKDRKVVLLDLPGHGKSDKLYAYYPIERLAAAVLDVMDEAKIPRAILIGNSLGGTTALAAALVAPRRVSGLVLIAAPGGRRLADPIRKAASQFVRPAEIASLSGEAWATGMWLARARGTKLGASITDDLQRLRSAQDHRAWSRAVDASLHQVAEWAPPLAAIEAPTLVIHGAWDPLVWRSASEALARQLPRGELVVLDDCGHLAEIECADLVLEQISAWSARLDAVSVGP